MVFMAVFALLSLVFSIATIPVYINTYEENSEYASLVFQFADRIDSNTSYLLCDYQTYQAFYDYERVYVYNRLPWYVIKGASRYYPRNEDALARLLEEKIEYIVVSQQSLENIMALLISTGQEPIEIIQNERYSALRLR